MCFYWYRLHISSTQHHCDVPPLLHHNINIISSLQPCLKDKRSLNRCQNRFIRFHLLISFSWISLKKICNFIIKPPGGVLSSGFLHPDVETFKITATLCCFLKVGEVRQYSDAWRLWPDRWCVSSKMAGIINSMWFALTHGTPSAAPSAAHIWI